MSGERVLGGMGREQAVSVEAIISAERLPVAQPLRLAETALFLDLDGTLAPIAARPQDVHPSPTRTRLIRTLGKRLDGRLAVISGRTLADVDRILEHSVASVAAVHGLVLREGDGAVHERTPHPGLAPAHAALRAFAAQDSGLLVEDKGASVALHFRLARHHAAAARALARQIAQETGLVLQDGDMVEELRTPGPTKGDSIRAFMAADRFRGALPIFVGDDSTDEHGFEAADRLGGFGVLVGPPRPTHARFGLSDVSAVMDWLEAAR